MCLWHTSLSFCSDIRLNDAIVTKGELTAINGPFDYRIILVSYFRKEARFPNLLVLRFRCCDAIKGRNLPGMALIHTNLLGGSGVTVYNRPGAITTDKAPPIWWRGVAAD